VIDNPLTSKLYDKALREAALRLAWYMETHGPIPDKEIVKLTIAGHKNPPQRGNRQAVSASTRLKTIYLRLWADRCEVLVYERFVKKASEAHASFL
jgi:hypothetical protein